MGIIVVVLRPKLLQITKLVPGLQLFAWVGGGDVLILAKTPSTHPLGGGEGGVLIL
jgi:hypothetical protein